MIVKLLLTWCYRSIPDGFYDNLEQVPSGPKLWWWQVWQKNLGVFSKSNWISHFYQAFCAVEVAQCQKTAQMDNISTWWWDCILQYLKDFSAMQTRKRSKGGSSAGLLPSLQRTSCKNAGQQYISLQIWAFLCNRYWSMQGWRFEVTRWLTWHHGALTAVCLLSQSSLPIFLSTLELYYLSWLSNE